MSRNSRSSVVAAAFFCTRPLLFQFKPGACSRGRGRGLPPQWLHDSPQYYSVRRGHPECWKWWKTFGRSGLRPNHAGELTTLPTLINWTPKTTPWIAPTGSLLCWTMPCFCTDFLRRRRTATVRSYDGATWRNETKNQPRTLLCCHLPPTLVNEMLLLVFSSYEWFCVFLVYVCR